jgi:hypothetical protein
MFNIKLMNTNQLDILENFEFNLFIINMLLFFPTF